MDLSCYTDRLQNTSALRFVLSTAHLEVDMRRPHPVGSSRIGCRFNCLESILAFRVRGQDGGALKIRVEWGRIGIAGMRVAPVSLGLPPFDLCVATGLARKVQHPADDVEHLPFRTTGPTGYSRQIGGLRQL